ncbi:tetraspanin-7-like [Clavelina lepadiformis]|uniref:Tetraspanin n=1 Tax=Clavelina lepadiformis TaxID=159417 RepID=A0ABP0F2C7_CLALP
MASRRMSTTPAVTCMKTLLSIFTFVYWLIGIGLLVLGVYSKLQLASFNLLSDVNFSSFPYALIGIGIFITLTGFMGCAATAKGNTCLLRTYSLCLGLILLAELAAAFIVVGYRGRIGTSFEKGMTNAIANYNESDYKQAVDNAQSTLHCCGSANYTDYWKIDPSWEEDTVPMSCCKDTEWCKQHTAGSENIVSITGNITVDEYIYTDGCPNLVFGQVNSNLGIVLGSMFGVAGFQLIGLILACCLASTINTNKYELV